jgi:hypothetical protein
VNTKKLLGCFVSMDGNLYLKVFMLFEIIIEEDENIIAFV